MSKMMVQAILRDGVAQRTCWVEDKIKIGDKISLKNSDDPDRLWNVVSLGVFKKPANQIRTDWKVGGIG